MERSLTEMSKQDVYNLGQIGIDLVNSPLHVADGSVLQSQNAQLSPDDAELALKKRDGMAKVNSSAAAGTIISLFNVALADPS